MQVYLLATVLAGQSLIPKRKSKLFVTTFKRAVLLESSLFLEMFPIALEEDKADHTMLTM